MFFFPTPNKKPSPRSLQSHCDLPDRTPGGCWPNPRETALLTAGISPDAKKAAAAWQSWCDYEKVEDTEPAYQRLLPLVFAHFSALGIEEQLPRQLKQMHRRTWRENQLLFNDASKILNLFIDAGIDILVLKGLALAHSIYANCGMRPMSDMDLLVHPRQASTAIDTLLREGWTPTGLDPGTFRLNDIIASRHAWGFRNRDGRELDLHWRVLEQISNCSLDEDFWRMAVNIQFHGVTARTLNATDHLLHVCLHGIKWNRMPPLRWVADAATIINQPKCMIQWNRLIDLARQYRLVLPARLALDYLHDVFSLPIPQNVLKRFQQETIAWDERMTYYLRTQPPWPLGQLLIHWHSRYRQNSDEVVARRLARCLSIQIMLWRQRLWQTESPDNFLTLKHWARSTEGLLKEMFRSVPKCK